MIRTVFDKTCGRWGLSVPLLLVLSLVLSGCIPPTYQSGSNQSQSSGQTSSANTRSLSALEQLTELKEELKKLRNAVEETAFNAETAKRRQQNLFQDLDRRLLTLERAQRLQPGADGGALSDISTPDLIPGTGLIDNLITDPGAAGSADTAVVAAPTTLPADLTGPADDNPAPAGSVSVPEQQAYDQAFNLLKQSKYQDAIAGFEKLTETWPESQLADDAYYWMSEARYVNREFEDALAGFRTVASRYPDSPRVPEALLKIGYIQYDIGAYEEAAEIFRDLLARFPGHQVAVSAQTRLRRIEQTIQQ